MWRTAVDKALSYGRLSAGWYALLTGVVMVWLGYLLWGADDAAAPYVAAGLWVLGARELWRGTRAEYRRARGD